MSEQSVIRDVRGGLNREWIDEEGDHWSVADDWSASIDPRTGAILSVGELYLVGILGGDTVQAGKVPLCPLCGRLYAEYVHLKWGEERTVTTFCGCPPIDHQP